MDITVSRRHSWAGVQVEVETGSATIKEHLDLGQTQRILRHFLGGAYTCARELGREELMASIYSAIEEEDSYGWD